MAKRSGLRTAFLGAAFIGLTACSTTTPHVTSVAPAGAHLSQYRTFLLDTGKIEDPDGVKVGNQTEVGRALEADVLEELQAHGLTPAEKEPALTFTYIVGRRVEQAGEREWSYQEGALILTAVDIKTGQTVWWAHAQAVIDPKDKVHRHLKEAIAKAFAHYPHVK